MSNAHSRCRIGVIWIDWYPYHVARFTGLLSATSPCEVFGIELVGGIGVHAGLKFREELPAELPIETLMPESSWNDVDKWHLARLLWRKLSAEDPEVVLVPGYYTLPGVAAALWARMHGATSVLMTESTAYDHPRVGWKEWLKGKVLRLLFDWAVAGGRAHVDYLHQLGFRADRIAGRYDVVDNEFFRAGTDGLREQDASTLDVPVRAGAPYFVYVGRLAPEKNVDGLLQSWLVYRDAGGSWPLVFVGDGPQAAGLRAQAASSACGGDVHFAGLRTSHQLLPFYAGAGCFVIASTREPWGLVVNEAMAAGLPVLVSDRCGCAPDLVQQGHNGFVFDPLDRPGLSVLLRRIEDLSQAERKRMGQRSREVIREFSPLDFGRSVATIAAARSGPRPKTVAGRGAVESMPGGAR